LGLQANNGTIAGIELVGSKEKLSWLQQPDALVIKPSQRYPSETAAVYKINFKK
jgi:alpha-L-fucosidase